MRPDKHHRELAKAHSELVHWYESPHVYRVTTDRWRRPWQAEFDLPDWQACPRAYTQWGVRRKAYRWLRNATDQKLHRRLWYKPGGDE